MESRAFLREDVMESKIFLETYNGEACRKIIIRSWIFI